MIFWALIADSDYKGQIRCSVKVGGREAPAAFSILKTCKSFGPCLKRRHRSLQVPTNIRHWAHTAIEFCGLLPLNSFFELRFPVNSHPMLSWSRWLRQRAIAGQHSVVRLLP